MAQDLRLVLVTPEKTLLDQPVQALRFPLFDGQIGILPGRAPLVGRLGIGELRVTEIGGTERSYLIDGGFAQVKGPTVTLLTNRAIAAESLTKSEGEALRQKATVARPKTDLEFAAKARDLDRARKIVAIAAK